MPDYSCDGEAQSVKPVHLHVTKTGQVQQIKITGARHAPLSPHVTEIVSVSACWRLDVIERDNIFSRPKIFFLTFLVRRLHPEPLGGHLAPFLHLDTDRYSTWTWPCDNHVSPVCRETCSVTAGARTGVSCSSAWSRSRIRPSESSGDCYPHWNWPSM